MRDVSMRRSNRASLRYPYKNMIRRRIPKKKLMIYAIFMSVMFGSAGIIFYRTYVPPSGGTVPSSPVIQNSISGAPSPAGTIQQPTQINQQKPSVELLEDRKSTRLNSSHSQI